MNGVACDTCGEKLHITITGGEFYVREGSTLDNLNFEKATNTQIVTLDEPIENMPIDEDPELSIIVKCSSNPDHFIFAHTVSKIKVDLYSRIMRAARILANKFS